MIRQPEQSSIHLRALTDKLFSLRKISSDVADQAKNQYDELLNLVKYEKNSEFCNFDSKKDQLDRAQTNLENLEKYTFLKKYQGNSGKLRENMDFLEENQGELREIFYEELFL